MADPASVRLAALVVQRAATALHQRHRLNQEEIDRTAFGRLVDKVAREAKELRATEFRGLADHEWTAAAECVKAAFDRIGVVDSRLPLRYAMDPERLAAWLRATAPELPAHRELTLAGRGAYEQLSVLVCIHVVEFVAKHPKFPERIEIEQLSRLERIERHVSAPGDEALAVFEARYCSAVAKRLDKLELFGVRLRDRDFRYSIGSAYMSLQAHSRGRILPDSDRPLRIEDLLRGQRRMLVTGEAGSGKTTLLRRVALWAARDGFPEALADWEGAVPFFLVLRHFFFETNGPEPERFLDQIGTMLRAELPPGWIRGLMDEGRAVLLVDGVDELTAAERDVFWGVWLPELLGEYPRVRMIVASRPAALSGGRHGHAGLPEAALQPMGPADQRAFIAHWHRAVAKERPDRAVDLANRRHDLLNRLLLDRDLRRLAANPLLCALICTLHHEQRLTLPNDRIRLYDDAIAMLLASRDEVRGVPASAEVRFGEAQRKALLGELAYWMTRNGYAEVTFEEAVERVAHYARPFGGTADPDDLVRMLLLRSGILCEPGVGRVDFVHPTFQRFLAAKQALAHRDLGQIVNRAGEDDQWHEMFVMAVRLALEHDRNRLVHGLLARATQGTSVRADLVLLAAEAVGDASDVDPALRVEVARIAAQLLPPASPEEAVALAKIGQPLLGLLPESLGAPSEAGPGPVHIIRLLAEIGGESAMAVLARYAAAAARDGLPHPRLSRAFYAAWDAFDDVGYARSVLSRVPPRTGVAITSPRRLAAAAVLPCLPWVELDGDRDLLERLCRVSGLKGVVVTVPALRAMDLRLLARCPDLTQVHLVAPGYSVRWHDRPLDGLHQDDIPFALVPQPRSERVDFPRITAEAATNALTERPVSGIAVYLHGFEPTPTSPPAR
ncbi:NACHT domain-containing protein [Yinghuangia aomiensis]